MQDELLGVVLERIDASAISAGAADVLLAACDGDAALDAVLGGATAARPQPHATGGDASEPAGAYLRSVTVGGFRGIGKPVTLELDPGPGLTVVTGRNGSGKSSFAEGLEMLFTGQLQRWMDASAVWREGWRNLHDGADCQIAAELYVEDAGPTEVCRRWADDVDVNAGVATAQVKGQTRHPLEKLGWSEPLKSYRPFLSHNELEAFFGTPSDLHDLLASVLGLDDLADTATRLALARRTREGAMKAAKSELAALLTKLGEIDDERAQTCSEALSGRNWELDVAQGLATGTSPTSEDSDLGGLRRLAQLTVLGEDKVLGACEEAISAATELGAVANTDAGRAARLADLLQRALDHHDRHGDGPCPVCGRDAALDPEWHAHTQEEITRLRAQASAATSAEQRAATARDGARALVQPAPDFLTGDPVTGLDTAAATAAWNAWMAIPAADGADGLRALAAHLETTYSPLAASVSALRDRAGAELDRREDVWAPLASEVSAWCARAREAESGMQTVPGIKEAEAWLKGATDDIRNARLVPLADEAKAIWLELRQESNVELGAIRLTGAATRRHVAIDVTVDGSQSVALGVMSQGEINALALAIFLPRATMPASPFRFLIVDDPVQAMDPAKVDGLARVLHRVGASRQVVVFTHDNRLPEAVRRLKLPATILDVTRRTKSHVEITVSSDPSERALKDAGAVCADDRLEDEIAARIVGPLCRTAADAAFVEVARSKLLQRGNRHAEVEQVLEEANSFRKRAALAMFLDLSKADQVAPRLQSISRRHVQVFNTLSGTGHKPTRRDLGVLINDSRWFVAEIRNRFT